MKILAFTGAGISKPSGIPTYEERPDLKDKLTREVAEKDTESFEACCKELLDMVTNKEPNDAHIVLAENDIPIITMNVDELHEKAGSSDVVHIHGLVSDGSIVLYGDSYDSEIINKIIIMIDECDFLVIIGTSFNVGIARQIADKATIGNKQLFVINEKAEVNVRKLIEGLILGG